MQINMIRLDNGVKYITLEGMLDIQGAGEIDLKFTAHASSEKAGVVVDLSGVSFIASIGIRMLVSAAKALNTRGGKMALINPQPAVADMLKKTGIDSIIPIFTDLNSACTAVLSAG